MKEKWIRKLIRKSRIGTVRRIMKFKSFSKLLSSKKSFITNVDQMVLENGKLISKGNDPKIFIRFHRPIKELYIEMQIGAKHSEDAIELFYSDIHNPYADFSYNQCYRIGKLNNKLISSNIVFDAPTQYIRLDLGCHEGRLDIQKCNIRPKRSKYAKDYNEYNQIIEEMPKPKKDNVVIVTHALNETGAPILAYNIAQRFQKKNYSVVVIALSDGYLGEKIENEGIPLFNLHQSLLSKEIYNPKRFEYLVKLLSKKGYNNVITNTIISGITTPFFKKYNFNIISLIHEMQMSILLYDMEQGGRDISMYSDKIVFPDSIVYKEFMEIFPEDRKKALIRSQGLYQLKESIPKNYNAIYEKYGIPKNSKIIMGSGTADLRKGIDLFLNAALKLIQKEEGFEYHFIWTGKILNHELEKWYLFQFYKYGLENRFHNVSFIKDKEEYQNLVACSDAFWLTSREDPFPSVMIEALGLGTPVLGFKNSGGANTLLQDGRGILIENFDIENLATETDALLKKPQEIENMLKKANNYIDKKLNFSDYINYLENHMKELQVDKKLVKADVSVIIPNYNYENFLPMRLRSIINQTVKPKEIILLDDASTDGSVEVAKSILDKAKKKYKIDYKIIKNKENNGCFRQWLKGIKEAQYPYIWIAEADDYAQENFIETLIPAFDDPKVTLAYTQSKVIDENSKVSDYKYTDYTDDLSKKKWLKDFKESGLLQVKEYFSKKNIIPNASSTIIRKSATDGLEEYLNEYKAIGDWYAYIYITSLGKVFYSSKCLNGHRRHSKSIIAQTEKSNLFLEEILKIKKYVIEHYELTDLQLNQLLLSIERLETVYPKIIRFPHLNSLLTEIKEKMVSLRKKKNILIIIPDLNVGGGQTVAIRLANSMTKYYNVFLVNTRRELETNVMREMIKENVTLLDYHDKVENLRMYKDILDFRAVISLVWWSDKLSYYAFGKDNIPLILSMHGCYEMLLHHPEVDDYFSENVDKILNRANRIVYIADKNKEILDKYGLSNHPKVSKIDNGFILENYPKKNREDLGITKDDFVFGLVARAIPEKGYAEAIEALNRLNARRKKKAHLILIGGSEYIDKLKDEHRENTYIHFIDKFTQTMEWIGWEEVFDVGLLPSYFKSESLPTVIVEYLYLKKPVIATDIAEIKSMIENEKEKCGIAIPLKNGKADVEILTQEMEKMMTNKDYYQKLSKNTTIFAKRFDMDLCIEKYRKLIEEEDHK